MATPKTPRKNAAKSVQEKAEDPSVDVTKAEGAMVETSQEADGTGKLLSLDEPEAAEIAQSDTPQAEPVLSAEPSPPDPGSATEEAIVLDEPKAEREEPKPDEKPQEKSRNEHAAPKPAAIAASPAVVKSGPGFVPLVLGGVVAAGLGFGLAQMTPEGWPVPGASPLQTQLSQQAEEIKALRAELQAMPKDDTKAVLDELGAVRDTAANALATAEEAKLAAAALPESAQGPDFTPQITALQERLTALETRPAADGAVDPAVLGKLTVEIDTLRSGLADQKAAAEQLVAEAEAVRADAAAKAQTVLLKAALTNVEAAMQNGASFAEPLTELTNAGLTIPAILSENAENGVPTVAALMASFDKPARAALEASLRGNMGSTWTDRVGSFLRAQTGARSLTPQEGTDPDAILSRANAAVATGDIQTALTEITTLPEAAQEALSAWVAQAKLRFDAQAATAALATALSER
ncbi:hypothetical protein [Pseudorhodobacter wandonensis]|uniref:hypothetical protein n=1 Tax=Pseudorhodobacter wandonensis TaxID=1120568 RepID=UPI00067AC332|nr:hypothetical protein [Pseudorhodobacter wandonensis]